jgi:hypothetical protein
MNIDNIGNIENINNVYRFFLGSNIDLIVDDNQRKLDMVVISNPKNYWGGVEEIGDPTYYLFGIQQYDKDLDYSKIPKHDNNKDYKIGDIVFTTKKIYTKDDTKLYFICIKDVVHPKGLSEKYWKALPQFFVPCLILSAGKKQTDIIKVSNLNRYLVFNANNLNFLKEYAYEIDQPSICFYSRKNKTKKYEGLETDENFTKVWLNFAKLFAKTFKFKYLVLEDAVSLPITSFKGDPGKEFDHVISSVSLLNYAKKGKSFYEEYGFEVPKFNTELSKKILEDKNKELTLQLRQELIDAQKKPMTKDFLLDFVFLSFYAPIMTKNIDDENDTNYNIALKKFKDFYVERKLNKFMTSIRTFINNLQFEDFKDSENLKQFKNTLTNIFQKYKKILTKYGTINNITNTVLLSMYNELINYALQYVKIKYESFFQYSPFDNAILNNVKEKFKITETETFKKCYLKNANKLTEFIKNNIEYIIGTNNYIQFLKVGLFLIGNLKFNMEANFEIIYLINNLVKDTYLIYYDKMLILKKILKEEQLDIRNIKSTKLFKILKQLNSKKKYFFILKNKKDELVKYFKTNNTLKIIETEQIINFTVKKIKITPVEKILTDNGLIFLYYEIFMNEEIKDEKLKFQKANLIKLILKVENKTKFKHTEIYKVQKEFDNLEKEYEDKPMPQDVKEQYNKYESTLQVSNLWEIYFTNLFNYDKEPEFDKTYTVSNFFYQRWEDMKNYPSIINSLLESLRLNYTSFSYNIFYGLDKERKLGNLHLLYDLSKFDEKQPKILKIKKIKKIQKQGYFLNLALQRKEIINPIILA